MNQEEKSAYKLFIKRLPIWDDVSKLGVEIDLLKHQAEENFANIDHDYRVADRLPSYNLTGKKIVKPREYWKRHNPDIVKLYSKNENGEIIVKNEESIDKSSLQHKSSSSTNSIPSHVIDDSTIAESIRLLERKPEEGELVFAVFKEKQPWVKCKIKRVFHKPINDQSRQYGAKTTVFRLNILDGQENDKKVIEVTKFGVARIQNHGHSLRVPKRVIAGLSEKEMLPGILGQEPCESNKHRYLVLLDTGSAEYFTPNQIYPICYQSEIPWRDLRHLGIRNKYYEAELTYFFKHYPARKLLQVSVGARLEISKNGMVVAAEVTAIDCDVVRLTYLADKTVESVYRGSARILKREDFVSLLLANQLDFDKLYIKLPGLMKKYKLASADALRENYINFCENFNKTLTISGRTARKSTATRTSSEPPLKIRFDEPQVDDDHDSHPFLKDLLEINDCQKHKCSPDCLTIPNVTTESSVVDIVDQFRDVSDLKVPLLLGWRRKKVRNNTKFIFVYIAPCGKIFQSIYRIRQYILSTHSRLDTDYFTLDPRIRLNGAMDDTRAFYFEKNIAKDKTTGKPLENKFVSVMNKYDEERLPMDFEYRSETFPHPMLKQRGFSFNREFKSGCDCEDDCSSRASCFCQRLSEQACGSQMYHRGAINMKCQYKEKRLSNQVRTGIFECNSFCKCSSKCPNRVVQNGIRFRLQVEKTQQKGWGVITLDDIPAGAFICTYSAELLDNADEYGNSDMYYADLDYITVVEEQKLQDDEHEDEGLDVNDDNDDCREVDATASQARKRVLKSDSSESEEETTTNSTNGSTDYDSAQDDEYLPRDQVKARYPRRNRKQQQQKQSKQQRKLDKTLKRQERSAEFKSIHTILNESHDYTLDARMQGNIGRFFNHSCDPCAFVQNVFIETHDLRFPEVAFFSKCFINAGTEITWNYNYKMGSIEGREIKCNCEAPNCPGRIL